MTATPDWSQLRQDLQALNRAALSAADPAAAVRRRLRLSDGAVFADSHGFPLRPGARIRVVAFGKASLAMARAAVEVLGERIESGVVAHLRELEPGVGWPASLQFFAASHPTPDRGSLDAGDAALELVRDLGPADLVLVLASGGGSALIESLHPGIGIADVQALTTALQRDGADIVELNTVRRALSRFKGGGLLRTSRPAHVLTLLLSDVMGDRLDSIASGPTVPSPTGPMDAVGVLERHGLMGDFPVVVKVLRDTAAARVATDAPPPSNERAVHVLVGTNRIAADAVRAEAEQRGFHTVLITDYMQGEAREVGRSLGGMARGIRASGLPVAPPACLIFGGETTVTVRGKGKGGRNQETALGAALAMDGCERAAVLSFGTDGIDGPTRAAGAFATGDTIARAKTLGLSAQDALENNDAEPFFKALGDLWVTGPTGTNVNDLAVVLVYP